MPFKGVRVETGKQHTICYVEDFCDEFQQEIRHSLAQIFNGAAEVNEMPDYYTYKNTIREFLTRYEKKDENTKKGMIGELLAHILIKKHHTLFKTISVFKNLEERSIKKGFDIIYFLNSDNSIWYSEVKSGSSNSDNSTIYNSVLLKRAKDGIHEMFNENRDTIWENALTGAKLVLDLPERRHIRELLSNDSPKNAGNAKRNVILISVLYHCLTDKIDITSLHDFHINTQKESLFQDSILFSIQKHTFSKVESFLKSEV
jgi:hypothetical protein